MILRLALIVLIYASQPGLLWAQESASDMALNSSNPIHGDAFAIFELIPDLEELDCEQSCEGGPTCGEYQDYHSCVQDEKQGCFWSCR